MSVYNIIIVVDVDMYIFQDRVHGKRILTDMQ